MGWIDSADEVEGAGEAVVISKVGAVDMVPSIASVYSLGDFN